MIIAVEVPSEHCRYRIVQRGGAVCFVRSVDGTHGQAMLRTVRCEAEPAAFDGLLDAILKDYERLHDLYWDRFSASMKRWRGEVPGFRAGTPALRRQAEEIGNQLVLLAWEYQAAFDEVLRAATERKVRLQPHSEPAWFASAREDRRGRATPSWIRLEHLRV